MQIGSLLSIVTLFIFSVVLVALTGLAHISFWISLFFSCLSAVFAQFMVLGLIIFLKGDSV